MTHLLQFSILPTTCSSSTPTSHFFPKPITGITSTVQIRPSWSFYHVPQPQRMNSIKCMANPRRVAMVANQIRRELADMLLTDKVLQNAVLPETALGADLYLSSVTTITDVEVSTDLQEVKVYVSIFGDERGREVALSGLISKAKYVRGQLGKRMKLRLTPHIRFVEDESLERGSRVLEILDRIKKEKEQKDGGSPGDEEETSDLPSGDDEDWEGEYPDEDIVYVR